MEYFTLARTAIGFIVGAGSSILVKEATRQFTPAGAGILARIAVGGAGVVIAMMATDATTNYAKETMDEAVREIKNSTDTN